MARKDQVRREKGDKPLNIGLMTADSAISYYFQNIIKPTVKTAETVEQIPVIYADPERWKTIQKGGFIRDKKGKAMLPLITYKRTNVERMLIGTKVDVNNPLYQSTVKSYNDRNRYDNFSILTNRKPVVKRINTVIPDYVKLAYDCIILTEYIEQLNTIIEDINYAANQYWGDDSFKFLAKISDFSVDLSVEDGQDRAAKSAFNIEMHGYIIPQNVQKQMSEFVPVDYSTRQVIFNTDVVQNINNPQTDLDAEGLQEFQPNP